MRKLAIICRPRTVSPCNVNSSFPSFAILSPGNAGVPPEDQKEFTTLDVWRGRVIRFYEVHDPEDPDSAPLIAHLEIPVVDHGTLFSTYRPPAPGFADGELVLIRYCVEYHSLTGAFELELLSIQHGAK